MIVTFRDVWLVASQALASRRGRTILLACGPLLGVAALIAVLGIGESAKGQIRDQLRQLGDNLVVVDGRNPASPQTAKLPADSQARARIVPTVSKAAAVTAISSVSISATMADDIGGSAVQTLLFAAGAEVRDVLGLKLAWGRFLTPADESIRAAVIGAGLAQHWRLQEGDARTIELNGRAYAVVGVLAPVSFMADVDQSVFISFGMAVRDWSDDGRPTRLVVRTDEGRTASTAAVLPLAIGLGRPVTATVTVPSDLLQAGARVDATLQLAGVAMAILALAVGALGISNVMAISVIQRRIEIGVRRALGQTQSLTALQFLSEGLLIGMVGAAGGVTCGVAFVIGACLTQGWALSLPTAPLVFGVAGSLAVSAAASIYPARMAARVEPLETLRSG